MTCIFPKPTNLKTQLNNDPTTLTLNFSMEFFRIIPVITSEKTIQEELTLENLDSISNELFVIGDQNETEANIGGIWGEFTLARSKINGGIRFALTECPNALVWTLTTGYDPEPESIVLHLTINRKEKQQTFLDEIKDFLDDHEICLLNYFNTQHQ